MVGFRHADTFATYGGPIDDVTGHAGHNIAAPLVMFLQLSDISSSQNRTKKQVKNCCIYILQHK